MATAAATEMAVSSSADRAGGPEVRARLLSLVHVYER